MARSKQQHSRKDGRRTRQDRGQVTSFSTAVKKHGTIKQRSADDQRKDAGQQIGKQRFYNLRSRKSSCSESGGIEAKEQQLLLAEFGSSDRFGEKKIETATSETCTTCGGCEYDSVTALQTTHPHQDTANYLNDLRHPTHPTTGPPTCRDCHPENFPDLDFHHSFGSFLTRKNPILNTIDRDIGRYWALLNKSPTVLQHHIHRIGDRYRDAFRRFFTAEPISLHGHVSDASSLPMLTSLILHLESCSSSCGVKKGRDDDDDDESGGLLVGKMGEKEPGIAMLEGAYGAGFGNLAYEAVQRDARALGNGKRPVVIRVDSDESIDEQVRSAKGAGCVALIAEIVRARDGVAISSAAWRDVVRACGKWNLILVVDEALTAIRCGAPFAYQLPQYEKHGRPDLVLFGKAVRTNGVAVDWRGVNIRKLEIDDPEERVFAVLGWQERLTEMAPVASLLSSWGTLVLAEREQWPRRAREIGLLLRRLIASEGIPPSSIGGLHSLLYLRVEDQKRVKSPVMGANAGDYVRWLPTMDRVMMSEKELRGKVFGPGSMAHRRDVAAYVNSHGLWMRFCARCGGAVEIGLRPPCYLCVVPRCEDCEPKMHLCPMEKFKRIDRAGC